MKLQTDTIVSENTSDRIHDAEKEISPYPICKICFLHKNPITSTNDLIAPCGCKGSVKYVHQTCLRLWRFKGKHIREIKRCEQCLCEYRYLGDYLPHKFVVKMTTVVFILSFFYILHCVMNSLIEAVSFLINDDNESLSYEELISKMRNQCNEETFFNNHDNVFQNAKSPRSDSLLLDGFRINFKCSVVIIMSVYIFTFSWSFWPVLNFFFTVWRVFQFNFWWDRYLLGTLLLYYACKLYRDLYAQIDTLYVFLLNYKG